jgi:hypothetical protein
MPLDALMEYAGQRIVQHLFLDIGEAIDCCDPDDLEDTCARFRNGLRYLADRTHARQSSDSGGAGAAAAASSSASADGNISVFLSSHLLAIFTKLNDPLLRMGAANVAPKRHALETLIFLVGYVCAILPHPHSVTSL